MAVAALVVTMAGLYWWRRGARRKARAKALKTFTEAPGPGPDTTLVLTDIEGSTALVSECKACTAAKAVVGACFFTAFH